MNLYKNKYLKIYFLFLYILNMHVKFHWWKYLEWEENWSIVKTERTLFLYSITKKKIEIFYDNKNTSIKENLLSIEFWYEDNFEFKDKDIWIIQTLIDCSYLKEFKNLVKIHFEEWKIIKERDFLKFVTKDLIDRFDNYFSSRSIEDFLKSFSWLELNELCFYDS